MIGAARPLADRAGAALAWWAAELKGTVPRRLRERRRRAFDAEVRLDAEGWTARDRAGRHHRVTPGNPVSVAEVSALIRGRRKLGRVLLVVPLARCFTRRSEIPRRMLGRATAILGSELEIATPFHPGIVHWDWFSAAPGSEPGLVAVQQVVLKRRDTEGLSTALAPHGVTVASIAVEDDATGRRLPVDLARHDGFMARDASDLRGARRLLFGTAVAASLAIVPAAFSRQSATLGSLDGAIADATDAVALRPGLARAPLQAIGDALAAKRDWPASAVLNGLAASLPADSHLEHIFLERDVVTIQGRTASLHNLERSFASARLFTAGHNTAPADTQGDGVPFTLRLKVRPVPHDSEA